MKFFRSTSPATLLVIACCLAACGTQSALDRSGELSRLGDHHLAMFEVERMREAALRSGSVDLEMERHYASVRARFLLEEGRRMVFVEQEEEALALLAGYLAWRPDDPEALELIQKAKKELAAKATRRGEEHLIGGRLHEALEEFEAAERHVPGWPDAVEGASLVEERFARLHRRAQQQFLDAIRRMPELRYVEARWHAVNAFANDPARNDADKIAQRAKRELARQAMARAQTAERSGHYGAALSEYRAAAELDPTISDVKALIDAMQREVDAKWRIERAQMEMRRGAFAEARKNLDEAFQLSRLERNGIAELQRDVTWREGERVYSAAKDLELLGKKDQALAAFRKLAEQWPDGLLDVKTRIVALETDIELATREFAEGEAAEEAEPAKALDHFRNAARAWPGMRDVDSRIERLVRRIADSKQEPPKQESQEQEAPPGGGR